MQKNKKQHKHQPLYNSFEGKMFLNANIRTGQLKRTINISCSLQFIYFESGMK
jgi:hypothetical protein